MKATVPILSGWLVLLLSFSANWAEAGPGNAVLFLSAAGVSQSEGTLPYAASDDRRQQTADLLRRARQAMKENDLAAANTLIAQAESLRVEYSPITMEDTPQKARQALDQLRRSNGGLTLPSGKRSSSDPFLGHGPAGPSAAEGVMPLPPTDPANAIHSASPADFNSPQPSFNRGQGMAPPTGNNLPLPPALQKQYAPPPAADRAQSDNLLRMSRRSLAVGDIRRAVDMLNQAKRLQVHYALTEDSPEKVEAAISKYQEIMGLERSTEQGRRAYARMLMEQAEALLRYGEYEQAEELADRAARQQVAYGAFESKPQDLLARISAARRQIDSSIQPLPPPSTGYPVIQAGGAMPTDRYASPAVYNTAQDPTRNVMASNQETASPVPPPPSPYPEPVTAPPAQPMSPPPGQASPAAAGEPNTSPGMALFQQGEAALRAHDRDRRLQCFRQAMAHINELDPLTAQRLQDHLQLLAAPNLRTNPAGRPPLDEAVARQQALAKQVATELERQEAAARSIMQKDPKNAMALLQQERTKIEAAGLEPQYRDTLLRNCDRNIANVQEYIAKVGPRA